MTVSSEKPVARTVTYEGPELAGPVESAAAPALATRYGRIPILDISPVIENGQVPAKAVPGSRVHIAATVFREGHDLIGAEAVLRDAACEERERIRLTPGPDDRWTGSLTPQAPGNWTFEIESFADLYATWAHHAALKIAAGVDTAIMLAEGADLLRAAAEDAGHGESVRAELRSAAKVLADGALPAADRLAAGLADPVRAALTERPLKDLITRSEQYPITVYRTAAGYGAWYEFFLRSEGAMRHPETGKWTSGNLRTAVHSLDRVAAMGFDVIYLPPIHPIGEVNRKGPNNSLTAGPEDPGSPWAIGSRYGGHDAIHPDLGDFHDFRDFVTQARRRGLEVALDLALQAAPDHPWVTEHPEWFTTRVDGSIAYAENPPKKYQDIYPLNFDHDPEGLAAEVLRIVLLWVEQGVRIFRVDNPHTKPLWFWEWLIAEVRRQQPEVVFLAEAFTRPAVMHALAKAGFHQSYSYFTWRNTKEEVTDYLHEVSAETAAFFWPNFFVNTPDILTEYLQYGGPAAFKIRAVLAAMGSPLWGVYAGYELFEHKARPGAEEYLDNEKYEYKQRDFAGAQAAGRSLAPYLAKLNQIRREHPALQELANLTVHATSDPATVAFSKTASTGSETDTIIVVVNVDPHSVREGLVYLDLGVLGLNEQQAAMGFTVDDLITGQSWQWGRENYVRLDAHLEPAHILSLRRP